MKLNFLNLGIELTADMRAAQERILDTFQEALGDVCQIPDFVGYATESSFLDGFRASLDDSDVVVVTVDPELFPLFKKFMGDALGLKMRSNRSLQKHLQKTCPDLPPEAIPEQAELPAEADALLSEDGLYSGFAIKANRQILVALPLDPARMEYLMRDSVLPYLQDHMDAKLFFTGNSAQVKEVAPIKEASGKDELKAEVPQTQRIPINEPFVAQVVAKLYAAGKQVSVADTKTVDFLKNVAALINMQDTVLLSQYTQDKAEGESSEDYIVRLARQTQEQSGTPLGAVVSKVYARTLEDGTKDYYLYVSISDGRTANEAKVTALPGDTPPELIYRAIEVLFHMINSWLDSGSTRPADDATISSVDTVSPVAEAETETEAEAEAEAPAKKPIILS